MLNSKRQQYDANAFQYRINKYLLETSVLIEQNSNATPIK